MAAQPHPPILHYRFGVPGGDRVQHTLRELIASESMGLATAAFKVIVGLAMCFAPPFFLTCMIWVYSTGRASFGITFFVLSLIAIPYLLLIERRTRGQFLEQAMDAITPRTGSNDPWTNWDAGTDRRTREALAAIRMETGLFGPRLLWSVYDWYRERKPVEPPVRVTAAEIAVELFDANNSLRLRELVRPHRSAAEVIDAANFLVRCEWADLYRDSLRLRLRGGVRKRLERFAGQGAISQ